MGKRHRTLRRRDKALSTRLGYTETELGEIKATTSKAEARRRFLRRRQRIAWEVSILEALCKRASEDLCALEDAAFLEKLEQHFTSHGWSGPPRGELQ